MVYLECILTEDGNEKEEDEREHAEQVHPLHTIYTWLRALF